MLHAKLLTLFPDHKREDWILVDDGNGPYIFAWNRSEPKPTVDEINAVSDVLANVPSKLQEITRKRNTGLTRLTTMWDGDLWDANEETSNRIANALSMIREASAIGIPTPPSISWRTADNKDRTLTIRELVQMGANVFLAQQEVWAKQAQLKNTASAAKTVQELENVKW